MIELGGNIKLTGFKELDSGTMVILKKIIGNYARKMSEHSKEFSGLDISMKTVSGIHPKYEVHGKFIGLKGEVNSSECVDRNLFVCVDNVLKKLLAMISK